MGPFYIFPSTCFCCVLESDRFFKGLETVVEAVHVVDVESKVASGHAFWSRVLSPHSSFTPMKTYGKNLRDDNDPLPASKRRRLSPDAGHSLKLTRRMLGRSKTESSIASPPPPAAALTSRTFSMPALPPQPPPPEQERRPAVSIPRVKHTYAGQSRSFLISLPVTDINADAIQGVERIEDDLVEPESYSSLRHRWGVSQPEDDTPSSSTPKSRSKSNSNNGTPSKKAKGKAKVSTAYLPPNMMNPLKSITELRSKGESRRFLDEVGYLFEGMDPSSSTGLKRSR